MRSVMLHEARQVPSWLIFDVGQKNLRMIDTPFPVVLHRSLRAVAALLMALFLFVHFSQAAEAFVTLKSTAPSEVIQWIRGHAVPIRAVEAGSGFEDLEPLRQMIGDARIVALGEATHGSREISQMNHRLIEFLASEMGFTILAIEANMPEARRVTDYIAEGRGDPATLIRGMYFWNLRTTEMLATIEWMRRFNAQNSATIPRRYLEFTGFDMQVHDGAVSVVRDYVARWRPDLVPKVDKATKALEGVKPRDVVGVATGSFPVELARGRRVTFSGWIKTDNVTDGYAGLIWRADTEKRTAAVLNNMYDTGPRGTTDWKRYEMTLDVPEDVTVVSFGMLLSGKGTAWFDELEIKIEGERFSPGREFDFDFEQNDLVGFFARQGSFNIRPVPESHRGKQSLRFESIDLGEDTTHLAIELWSEIGPQLRLERDGATDRKSASWAARCARIVQQMAELNAPNRAQPGPVFRDACMAENVQWLLEDNPDAKLILWAHNAHVRRSPGSMGGFLTDRLTEKMVVIGYTTGRGSYGAWAGRDVGEFPLQSPPTDSIESAFLFATLPRFLMDLRRAPDGEIAKWFREVRPHGLLGRRSVAQDYDIIAWIEETTPSIRLPAPIIP